MINKTNVKYVVDLLASLVIIVTCVLVTWMVVSSRRATGSAAEPTQAMPAIEDVASKRLSWSVAEAPLLGQASAPFTLIEFSDFECPFCRRYAEETFDEIKKLFIDTGVISYAYVHNPLPMHRSAFQAARVAACAGDQGSFWDMRAGLFSVAKSPGLSDESIATLVDHMKLERPVFDSCLDTVAERVQRDLDEAARIGVRVTPTFLVGVRSSDGMIDVRSRINGAQPLRVFVSAIEELSTGAVTHRR